MSYYDHYLIRVLKEYGVVQTKDAPYVLSTGRKTDIYFDMARALGQKVTEAPLCAGIHTRLIRIYRETTCIAAMEFRDALLGKALASRYGLDFAGIRKESKQHGTRLRFECHEPIPDDNISVLADVWTTGTTLRESIRIVKGAGANVVSAGVPLVRTEELTEEKIKQMVDDEFSVDGVPFYFLLFDQDFTEEPEKEEKKRSRWWPIKR